MYICPFCQAEYPTEERMQRHYLACWKEKFPSHQSKDAPKSEDIVKREVNNETMEFFARCKKNV